MNENPKSKGRLHFTWLSFGALMVWLVAATAISAFASESAVPRKDANGSKSPADKQGSEVKRREEKTGQGRAPGVQKEISGAPIGAEHRGVPGVPHASQGIGGQRSLIGRLPSNSAKTIEHHQPGLSKPTGAARGPAIQKTAENHRSLPVGGLSGAPGQITHHQSPSLGSVGGPRSSSVPHTVVLNGTGMKH